MFLIWDVVPNPTSFLNGALLQTLKDFFKKSLTKTFKFFMKGCVFLIDDKLSQLGISSDILPKVSDFINSNFVQKSLLDDANSTIDTLNSQINSINNNIFIDNIISNAGGRNVKAIKALFDPNFFNSISSSDFNKEDALSQVNSFLDDLKISDPYLFNINSSKKVSSRLPQNSLDFLNNNNDILINSARSAAGLL